MQMKRKPSISSSIRKQTGLQTCCLSNKIAKDSHFQPKVRRQAIELEDHSIKKIQADSCITTSCHDIEHSDAVGHSDTFSDVPLLVTFSSLSEKTFSMPLELKDCIWEQLFYSCAVEGNETLALPDLVSDDSDDNSTSSCDEKSCNLESFHVTNPSTLGLSAEGDVGLNISVGSSGIDYEYVQPELMPDAAERCMMLPFLEEIAVANNVNDIKSIEEALPNSDDPCLYVEIEQAVSSQHMVDYNSNYEDLADIGYFDSGLFIANFSDLSEAFPSCLPISLPMQMGKRKLITLVLDLDETLVHSSLEHCPDADFTFPMCLNMKEHTVYVRQRPHLHTFLERVAEMFEVIIFTASQSMYAEQLLNILDPDQKIISERVYREGCVVSDGHFLKDLTVLGRDLAKVVIIDNTPQVFQLQANNGIPIKSWFYDPTDSALLSLLPFLEILASADDVRPLIAQRFRTQD